MNYSIISNTKQAFHYLLFYCEDYEASNEIWNVYYEWQTGKDVGSNYHTCKVTTYSIMRWDVCLTHVSLCKPDCLLQSVGISYNDPLLSDSSQYIFNSHPTIQYCTYKHTHTHTQTYKHTHTHTPTNTHTHTSAHTTTPANQPTNQTTSRISRCKETPELSTKFTVSELSSMNKVHFFFFRL